MKKLFLLLAVVLGMSATYAGNNYSHDINILPKEARIVLKQNFKAEISHIKIGKEFGRIREYEVVMTDGSEITFDKHGNWKDVEVSRYRSVPSAIIPHPINTFVKKNQKEANVTGIEKKNYGYSVGLSNGIDVRFTEKGKFLSYNE